MDTSQILSTEPGWELSPYSVLFSSEIGSLSDIAYYICLFYKDKVCLFILSYLFGHPVAYGVPRPGIRSEPQLRPMPQLGQRQILYAGPGIKPLCGVAEMLPILLCHSRNSFFTLNFNFFLLRSFPMLSAQLL